MGGDLGEGEGGEGCDYDFSYLPEPVWVKVMEYLPLSDQYHVSVTCRVLYDVFNHPSNWKSARLEVVGGEHNFKLMKSFMADRFRIIVEKFGHYFQHLTVTVQGHLVAMEDSVRNIVTQLSDVCRLEHLVLEVGMLTSDFHLAGLRPVRQDLHNILLLVTKAFRLKKLEVVSWPMFPELFEKADMNVFEAMKANAKLAGLQWLSLFWMKNKQWSQRSPLLPSPTYTRGLVAHFTSLQHLALRSPMLSDELLKELAAPSRCRLLTLRVLLQYSAGADAYDHLPNLLAASWLSLRERSPALEVEFAVMSRISDIVLEAMLMPEVPLTTFRVLKYARCSPALLLTLSERYRPTLRSFLCYSDPTDCGEALVRLAERCTGLDTLVFHGIVHCTALLTITQSRPHWKDFEFDEKCIVMEPKDDEFDEDTVIGRSNDGDLVQVRLVRFHGHQSETEREQQLNALKAEVSGRMDHAWRPL